MKWGLGVIGGACVALVLGIAVVAPARSREARPDPSPSSDALTDLQARPGLSASRALVPVQESPPEEPEEGASPTPSLPSVEELQDPSTKASQQD